MCGLAVNTSNSGSGGPGFKLGPLCCFLRQGTLLVVFPHLGVKMGTSDILPRGGCNPAMDWYPVQGEVAILPGMLHAKETRISCSHLGLWLICAFTFFYHSHKMHLLGSNLYRPKWQISLHFHKFNKWNPYPFIYLKPERGTPFGCSLPWPF